MEKDFIDRLKLHAHARTDVLDPVADMDVQDGDYGRVKKALVDFPEHTKSAEDVVTDSEFKASIYEMVTADLT